MQNTTPTWAESHKDWNLLNPTSTTPKLDGFVAEAAHDAQKPPPTDGIVFDRAGIRAMGYYDGNDLNYYYFMVSKFATSDRWFSPVMTRTEPNRLYLLAGTSAGHAYPLEDNGLTSLDSNLHPTIFQSLDKAGISWRIYETDPGTSYIYKFQPYADQHTANIVPASQFATDAQNGTLPAVALIESGGLSGLDEHPRTTYRPAPITLPV